MTQTSSCAAKTRLQASQVKDLLQTKSYLHIDGLCWCLEKVVKIVKDGLLVGRNFGLFCNYGHIYVPQVIPFAFHKLYSF